MAKRKRSLKYEITDKVAIPLEEAYEGDVGYDLVSTVNRTVSSFQRIAIPTGIKLQLPSTLWASIREKSGVSINSSLSVKAGVIDPGYRGEIKVVICNHNLDPIRIARGDKIAQIVIHEFIPTSPTQVDEIEDETDRGEKGFGSSDG